MAIGKLPSMLCLDEYPLMKTYRNRRLPVTILLASVLVFSGLIIFNVITQGKSDKYRTFISLKFLNKQSRLHGKSTSGVIYRCEAATEISSGFQISVMGIGEGMAVEKVFSTTAGNSLGAFGICFSVMVAIARRLDNLPKARPGANRRSDSSETLDLEEGEDHPLGKASE
ncbi:uncharacterized protein PGTG_12233 [Puccinia graminis f. sp. tritici CRL 75-36-700-3]|uniref:Uncharacterized protein n=1 Tax=Puccinia graminis f. sp. tritici (strain CRL 75-36-700-3 / race SCCL) TaxID=418459 RepID=E3KPP2_PUCGT|nr:uncharacterized protein PGTG_12233 [Puccinia graminis f. sp. tritici CRL 75-36-700-3]EFP86277.2 hypothetical protein PGTG_12233 [Puccinia graminis f. sp. tritici CRL 75-36-700-3]